MTFDQFTKLTAMLGATLLGVWAAFTYYDTANRELERPFNDAQLSSCKEASDSAATLAAIAPRPEKSDLSQTDEVKDPWRLARVRFEQLYWGSLAIFENSDVEDKMVKFRTFLVSHEEDIRTNKLNTGLRPFFEDAALDIAHACRKLVSKTWQINLPVLTGKGATTARRAD